MVQLPVLAVMAGLAVGAAAVRVRPVVMVPRDMADTGASGSKATSVERLPTMLVEEAVDTSLPPVLWGPPQAEMAVRVAVATVRRLLMVQSPPFVLHRQELRTPVVVVGAEPPIVSLERLGDPVSSSSATKVRR